MSPLRLAAALAFLAPAAHAQLQPDAAPSAGTLTLRANATEMLDLTLQGTAESGRADCVGTFYPWAPDAAVEWAGGTLRLTARSATDVTLAVVDPQGTWHCNDDAEGLMPVVEIPSAPRGRYAVWVGTFGSPGGAATLIAGAPAGPADLDPMGTAQVTTSLQSGFGASQRWSVRAGGLDAVPSDLVGPSDEMYCGGFVDAARPTARVRYSGQGRLTTYVTAPDADPVLVVRTPDGRWLCDDDSGEGLNSAISVADAPAGEYAVWAGSFRGGARADLPAAEIWFDENEIVEETFDFDMDGMDMDVPPRMPYSTGTYQPLDLDARPRTSLALRGDDAVSATVTVRPDGQNPVVGDACRGLIETGATATVTLSGSGPIGITASADRDLVLLVRTPGGGWFCSDDADGLNPGIQIDDVESGAYRVWVGTFGFLNPDVPVEEISATLSVARGEITVSDGGFDGGFGMGEPYAEGVYDGQDLQTGRAFQTLGAGEATVRAGGALLNPVQGPTCAGFVDARASAAVEAGAGVSFAASTLADDDLVMVVRTPDGRWFCSDDSEGTTDPMVRVDDGPDGTYEVWVGTFSRRTEGTDARLVVTP